MMQSIMICFSARVLCFSSSQASAQLRLQSNMAVPSAVLDLILAAWWRMQQSKWLFEYSLKPRADSQITWEVVTG